MTYAVHTATCTYLLDEDGVCRWALSPAGPPPPGAERCVGAQFVASLDLSSEGGLVGELRPGAAALFVRQEGARFVLLRTLPILHVEIRGEASPIEDPQSFADTPIHGPREGVRLPAFSVPTIHDPATEPLPFTLHAPELAEHGSELDHEELMSISVTEVIVSLPVRAPPAAAPPLPAWPKPHPPPRRR
jgi:hypothetical protein